MKIDIVDNKVSKRLCGIAYFALLILPAMCFDKKTFCPNSATLITLKYSAIPYK